MGKIIPSHTEDFFYNMDTDDANEIIEEIMNIMKKHKVTVGDAAFTSGYNLRNK